MAVDEIRIAACVVSLESAARSAGHAITPDLRVSESVAAELLGIAAGTLRNWRSSTGNVPYHRIGGRFGRVTYKLIDLANVIEKSRTEF
jgi:hypothetical protein